MAKGSMNPAERQRQKDAKKFKEKMKQKEGELKKVREMLDDPEKVQEEIDKVQTEYASNRMNKGLKDRLEELQRMKDVALKKRQTKVATGKIAPPPPSISSSSSSGFQQMPMEAAVDSTGPQYATVPMTSMRPQDSVYFHPQFNPTGAPPPGQPLRFRQGAGQPMAPPPPANPRGYGYGPPRGAPPPVPGGQAALNAAAAAASAAIASAAKRAPPPRGGRTNNNGGRGNNNREVPQRGVTGKPNYDPLDPAAASYNDDLARRGKKMDLAQDAAAAAREAEKSREIEEKRREHQQWELERKQKLQRQQEEFQQAQALRRGEQKEEEDDEFEVDAAIYEGEEEEREQDDTPAPAPAPPSFVPPAAINVAELMARRKQLPAADSAATEAPEGPAKPESEPESAAHEDGGGAPQPAPMALAALGAYADSDDEEDDDEDAHGAVVDQQEGRKRGASDGSLGGGGDTKRART